MRYNAITAMVRDFPQQVGIAYTPQDMRRLHGEGKFAVFLSMLNAYALGDDIDQLDRWAARGVRMFGFSYVGNNSWADSSRPLPFFNDTADALDGLSPVGKRRAAAERPGRDHRCVANVQQGAGPGRCPQPRAGGGLALGATGDGRHQAQYCAPR